MPAEFLAYKLGLSKTMILGLKVLNVAASCAGFASSYWEHMCARVLESVGSSIYVSAASSFVLLSLDTLMRGTNI
ncbi:MAG TPA: hypothetical protein VGE97_05535 [Nitrososphaera sp.]|jgi:hypothetical protein